MVKKICIIIFYLQFFIASFAQNKMMVFQTDFGSKDGAVAAMKGVAMGIDSSLKLFDLTHEIPAFNIWEAAFRLEQTVPFWPPGTVFISVVDPGVGTERRSVVLQTKTGHFIVTPDNGTLTLIASSLGIAAIRSIDEEKNRRENSSKSYTFHGRDVYAYTAARLASGIAGFEDIGPALPKEVVSIPFQKASLENNILKGTISILDIQYGNIWTNIPDSLFKMLDPQIGDQFVVDIFKNKEKKYSGTLPYCNTFGAVALQKPLLYLNSLLQVAFALNMGNFSEKYKIYSGNAWSVHLKKRTKRK